jgi:hypothetical protein
MKVQFANGKTFEAADIDDAIAQCLAGGDDPFNPVVLQDEPKQYSKKTKDNADTVEQ